MLDKLLLVLVTVFAMAGGVRATILVTLNSGPVADGAAFRWTYTATLQSGSTLLNGDYFTIYDIGGFGPGFPGGVVILPSGWSVSTQRLGKDGFRQAPLDSNGSFNATYTYVNGPQIVATVDTILGGVGSFGYSSALGGAHLSGFSATSHVTSNGTLAGNTSLLAVAGTAAPPPPLSVFDIDGNGNVDALTDGLLFLRYLFGLRGITLTQNAVGTGAFRTSATDIQLYIQSLLPMQ